MEQKIMAILVSLHKEIEKQLWSMVW